MIVVFSIVSLFSVAIVQSEFLFEFEEPSTRDLALNQSIFESDENTVEFRHWQPGSCPRYDNEELDRIGCYASEKNKDHDIALHCIYSYMICDGYPDCPLHEDEDPLLCSYFLMLEDLGDDLLERVIDYGRLIHHFDDYDADYEGDSV